MWADRLYNGRFVEKNRYNFKGVCVGSEITTFLCNFECMCVEKFG
jgi:hypothetical protein